MTEIKILTRPECHLCDEAKLAIADGVDGFDVEIVEVDIRDDADLEARYRWDIPVFLIDGEERFRHRVDTEKLRDILATIASRR